MRIHPRVRPGRVPENKTVLVSDSLTVLNLDLKLLSLTLLLTHMQCDFFNSLDCAILTTWKAAHLNLDFISFPTQLAMCGSVV